MRIAEADVRDAPAVTRVMQEAKPDRCHGLARHPWETDARRFDVVTGGATVITASAAAGCAVLVNAGSSSEYGFKDHAPRESEEPEPNSDYAMAKVAATTLARDQAARLSMRIVTLRLYSVYGPWEDPRRLLPALIVNGLNNQWPPLVNPDIARDYVFAADVADAFQRAAAAAPTGSVYNVGTGVQTSLRQAVDVAARALSITRPPAWSTMPARGWDTSTWVADARAIDSDLGWRPQFTFEQGFRRTVDWFNSHPELMPRYRQALQIDPR